MKSFALLRTNVGLTTNVKVMVDSNYRLSLESIDSNESLSLERFKKMSFSKTNFYDELVPFFYKEVPADNAFYIKFEDDLDTMVDRFDLQYDEIYQYGARNILNNKNYSEEYEYFAPLYIKRNHLPKKFIIFRVDGPGITLMNKDNFRSNIINKLKTVKLFDLTTNTDLGEWMERNFTKNQYFPESPLEIDFRSLEFCRWNGIDYETGGYTSKSLFIDDILDEEKELFELDKFIFDNYKNNKVVFPNILNFSFLFDDKPSTPDDYRKWTINRYLGFYLEDTEFVTTISPYEPPQLLNDVVIDSGNFIVSSTKEDPFIDGFTYEIPIFVEYLGEYYRVELVKESTGISLQQVNNDGFVSEEYTESFINKFKILSDIDLSGKENEINRKTCFIDSENRIVNYDGTAFSIDNFIDSDAWVIEIDSVYHNIIKDGEYLKLNTDYSFSFNKNDYSYKAAGVSTNVSFITDFNNPPKKFNIYKLKFTDIKDFDDRIVDTEYSKFEYEKFDELTFTDETKMYFQNINSLSNPKDLDDFKFKNEVVNIPVSSEYTANFETFKIENNQLTELWKRNPVYSRWVYQNSLSSNDYPYLLNNSQIFEDYNRTTNPFDPEPKRIERNLDYFYTINSSTSSYIHHTLHVEKVDNSIIDTLYRFDVDKYLNIATYSSGTSSLTYNFDYFTAFFERKAEFYNSTIKKNVKKYSEFNIGDNSIPNISLFRGIEYRIYDVDGVSLDTNQEIDTISIKSSNRFEDYKLSVLLSDNNKPFEETSCFELDIDRKVVEIVSYLGGCGDQELTYSLITSTWITSTVEIFNYLGWYFEISGVVTDMYISEVELLSPSSLSVTIMDDNGNTITDVDITSPLCDFRLCRLENRILVDPAYMDRLDANELIYIESDCQTGTFSIYEDNLGWNIDNTISLIGDASNSPIYFIFQVGSGLYTNTTAEISIIPFNGKYYYTLYDEDLAIVAYCIWQSSLDRWEIYEIFDGINATNLYAFSVENTDYPLSESWDIVDVTYINISSEVRPLIFSLTCSGTWCHNWQSFDNEMDWTIIDDWKMDREYDDGSVVVFEDILYISNSYIDLANAQSPTKIVNSKQVKSAPFNIDEWDYYNPLYNIFWCPTSTYNIGDYVYNEGNYYYYATSSGEDFWNPEIANSVSGYNEGDTVLFKGSYYISLTSSNNYSPDYTRPWFRPNGSSFDQVKFWSLTQSLNTNWKTIEVWNPNTTYVITSEMFVYHNDTVWSASYSTVESEEEPGISNLWTRIYSLLPDTNFIYNSDSNPIIFMNNRYYLINSNTTDSTLENGIVIYINKKWKNILINININDNTLPNINNADRDEIYDDLYKKITAYNFIQAINDISNKYEFTDYVKYVVIDENGNTNVYSKDNNITSLPYIIRCELPDLLEVKVESLDVAQVETPPNLKATKNLTGGNIKTLSQLNWFNNVPYAYSIVENQFTPKVFENLHGNKNILKDDLYRFSGYYMPLFYDIQIFEKDFEFKIVGNYKFDTSLTEFGLMKERRFRKTNRKGSLLKLRDTTDFKSIYPMLDEFGYSTEDFFIFRSTWDMQYHNETVENKTRFIVNLSDAQLNINPDNLEDIGQPISSQNQNFTS